MQIKEISDELIVQNAYGLIHALTDDGYLESYRIYISLTKVQSGNEQSGNEFQLIDSSETEPFRRFLNVSPKLDNEILIEALTVFSERGNWRKNDDYGMIIQESIVRYLKSVFPNILNNISVIQAIAVINNMASMFHEGEAATGKLSFFEKEPDYIMRFIKPVEFNDKTQNIKTIRKLLNISDKEKELCVYNGQIKGISHTSTANITFHMKGLMSWDCILHREIVLTFRRGHYRIPTESERRDKKFLSIYHKLYKGYRQSNDDKTLIAVLNEACSQPHGTSIIIGSSEKMLREARRLCTANKGQRVNINLMNNTDYVRNLTSIDGALILDSEFNCLAIGAILDGESTIVGDTARGSRYNSVRNYIAWLKRLDNEENPSNVMGVIISEDGAVDVVSSLDFSPPQGLVYKGIKFCPKNTRFLDFPRNRDYRVIHSMQNEIPVNDSTNYLSVIEDRKRTISFYNFDDPNDTSIENTYLFINLIDDNVFREDYRLALNAAEIELERVGTLPFVFQIIEVNSKIQGKSVGESLYGKLDSHRHVKSDTPKKLRIKLAYAYTTIGDKSVNFENIIQMKQKGVDTLNIFNPKEAKTIVEKFMGSECVNDIVSSLIGFTRTYYVTKSQTKPTEHFINVSYAKLANTELPPNCLNGGIIESYDDYLKVPECDYKNEMETVLICCNCPTFLDGDLLDENYENISSIDL